MTLLHDSADQSPLNRVQRGMHVLDAAGEDVGRVDLVQMGDPEADTTAGNESISAHPFDVVAVALSGGESEEPNVPEPLRSRLVREGYLKLEGGGLLEADRYVPAGSIRGVSEDRVVLSVPREALAHGR
ncbi:MAG: hypothetical protein JO057_13285 [Chloroflexi bacterium]|nr:hypothetical protein [Chloroflexota bacterium]